jgi:hypothetical protein
MKKQLKQILIILLILSSKIAFAVDFLVGEKFNPQTPKGYLIRQEDTIAGYPIFAADGDWKIYGNFMGQSTFGSQRLNQPFIYMERYQDYKWVMGQSISVSILGSGASSWSGDPCSGDKIIKIKVLRGGLDRCATSELKTIRIGGVQTETLEINFTETNSGGRLYQSKFNIHYENLGFSNSSVSNTASDFNKRLHEWMLKFQDALVKAAGFDKPADAFKDVPTFTDAVKSISTISSPSIQKQSSTNPQSSNIQDRLQVLKDLLDKKLITQDDFDGKRRDILNSL